MLEVFTQDDFWINFLISFSVQLFVAIVVVVLQPFKSLYDVKFVGHLLNCGICSSFWIGLIAFVVVAPLSHIIVFLPILMLLFTSIICEVLADLLAKGLNYIKGL